MRSIRFIKLAKAMKAKGKRLDIRKLAVILAEIEKAKELPWVFRLLLA